MKIRNHILNEAKFIESPNYNNRPNRENINLIVIHSICLPPDEYGKNYVEDFFQNKLSIKDHKYFETIKDLKVSSHLYIKRDGSIIQFVPFDKRAWHAGESTFNGIGNCNDYSIGIELEAKENDTCSDKQYEILIQASLQILENYPEIKKDSIVGHSEVSPKRKTDPGENFDWRRYLESL